MPALIIDDATPIITKLAKASGDAANEGLSKAGAMLQSKMRDRARAYGVLNTGQSFERGRRSLLSSDKGGKKKPFSRLSKLDGSQADGGETMADLIRFRVNELEHKLVMGYANVKGWRPTRYKDGERKGKMPYVKGVGSDFKKIGEKLEFGGSLTLSEKQKRFFKASGWGKAAKTGAVTFKARPIVNPVFSANRNSVVGIFEAQYSNTIRRIVSGQ